MSKICLDCTAYSTCWHCRTLGQEDEIDVAVVAENFLSELQNYSSRPKVNISGKVILVQNERATRFFAGFRKRDQQPVWAYEARLAQQFELEDALQHVSKLSGKVLLYTVKGEDFQPVREGL